MFLTRECSLLLVLLLTSHAFKVRILNADIVKENKFPYVVSIRDSLHTFCTGSIISDRFVITAKHCFRTYFNYSIKHQKLQVVAGVNDFTFSKRQIVIDVAEVYMPIEHGDIAVLKLKKDFGIKINPNLGKINLPEKNDTYAGVEATVIGFGWNEITKSVTYPSIPGLESIDGTMDGKMRYAKAKVIEHSECVKLYKEGLQIKDITWDIICAQVEQHNFQKSRGVCSGDSGGPLVYNNELIGVVNTSPPGCRENLQPGVYTRVTEFLDFIEKACSGNIDSTINVTTML